MADWIDNIPSAWTGHRKFAEWLVQDMGAKTVIELGVDRGFSLFSFANAGAKVYGVDLWQVDPNYGYDDYKPVLEQLAVDHNLSDRIELIRGAFSNVVQDWPYGAVDVLHIDGTHDYENVKSDFESWFKYVKEDGVVLIHDVCIPYFTVKEYFNEIPYPKAWFPHSCGLGIVCRDAKTIERIKQVFSSLSTGNVPI